MARHPPRSSTQDKPRRTRSRGGCGNCKKRRRKCDETRPACLACEMRNVVCDGYGMNLNWDWGVASRGNLAGSTLPVARSSEGVWRVSPRKSSRGHGSGSGSAGFEFTTQPVPNVVENPRSESPRPVCLDDTELSGGWDPHSEESRRLFTKFQSSALLSLSNGSSTDSKMNEMMLDLSSESPACFSACVALQLLREIGCVEKFFLCFESTLHAFRAELLDRPTGGPLPRGTLRAGLHLCTLSIEQGLAWTSQLKCMADLAGLDEGREPATCPPDRSSYHVLEAIAIMDLPKFVFGRQTPCIGMWKRLRDHQRRMTGGLPGGIEMMTALPRSLLDIFARVDSPAAQADFWLWSGDEGHLLHVAFWDIWRFCGILLTRRSRSESPSWTNDAAQPSDLALVTAKLPSDEHLLFRIVALMDALRLWLQQPENSHMLLANGMFYPYIIASSDFALLDRHPEWVIALDKVRELCFRDPSQNIRTAQALLEESRERGDKVFDIDQASRSRGIELAIF